MLFVSVLAPAVGAAALLALRPRSRRFRHAWTFAFTLLGSLLAAMAIFNPAPQQATLLQLTPELTISFRLDGLGRLFAGIAALLWPLATLYAFEYMEHEGGENTFFGFYLLSYAVTLGVAYAEDVMTLYIFYELLSFSTLFLVMHGMKPRAVHAGRRYAYYMLGGAALGFLAVVTVLHFGGASAFVPGGIPAMAAAPAQLVLPMFVLGFLGFGVKAAVFPFHAWLPAAGVAPTPVTALLHAVAVVKAGVFAVIRMSHYAFGARLVEGTWAQTACVLLALASILFGSAMAVREPQLKRRLAYSTMSNLSYVLLGAMLLTPQGLQGALLHMAYHALMKITLFCCVGAVMVKTGHSYVQELRGMGRRMPFVMGVFTLAGIALAGIPPMIGFQSKWALATAAAAQGTWLGLLSVCVLLVSAVLTAMYVLVPAFGAFFLPPDEEGPSAPADPGWRMKIPLAMLCILIMALAAASAPLTAWIARIAQGLV